MSNQSKKICQNTLRDPLCINGKECGEPDCPNHVIYNCGTFFYDKGKKPWRLKFPNILTEGRSFFSQRGWLLKNGIAEKRSFEIYCFSCKKEFYEKEFYNEFMEAKEEFNEAIKKFNEAKKIFEEEEKKYQQACKDYNFFKKLYQSQPNPDSKN